MDSVCPIHCRIPSIRQYLTTGSLVALALTAPLSPGASAQENGDAYAAERQTMIQEIRTSTAQTRGWIGKSELDQRVMEAMGRVPRHEFVPAELVPFAYLNRPLPVGHGQKVSQPYIVALMTDLAGIEPDDTVMIVGAGGGYHAAIASVLAKEVRCVEMYEAVGRSAMERLARLNYTNVEVRVSDPYYGWHGTTNTFDSIIVRQAMSFVPRALINQLKPGGRLVMPLGNSDYGQFLTVIWKNADGTTRHERLLPVLFTQMPGGPRI